MVFDPLLTARSLKEAKAALLHFALFLSHLSFFPLFTRLSLTPHVPCCIFLSCLPQAKEKDRDLANRESKVKPSEDKLHKRELEVNTREVQVKGRESEVARADKAAAAREAAAQVRGALRGLVKCSPHSDGTPSSSTPAPCWPLPFTGSQSLSLFPFPSLSGEEGSCREAGGAGQRARGRGGPEGGLHQGAGEELQGERRPGDQRGWAKEAEELNRLA